jgi:hypothetical protein
MGIGFPGGAQLVLVDHQAAFQPDEIARESWPELSKTQPCAHHRRYQNRSLRAHRLIPEEASDRNDDWSSDFSIGTRSSK